MEVVLWKVISIPIFIYCVSAIVYSLYFNIKNFIERIFNAIKNNKGKRLNRTSYKLQLNKPKKVNMEYKKCIMEFLRIKSKLKAGLIIWLLSFSVIIICQTQYKSSFFFRILAISCFIIFLIGTGFYINYRIKNQSLINKFISYIQKFGIFILYSSMFFAGFLSKLDNNSLFILAIFTLLIYSICFLKYVLDDFQKFIFLIFNLIFIYFFDLIAFGYIFGMFYITRNDIYQLVNDPNQVLSSITLYNNVIIINKGLYYFYNYSDPLKIKGGFNALVPLFQYILAAIFNIAIIGIFISYTAARVFIDDDKNKGENVNYFDKFFEELKKRKFKITIKKDD